VDFSLQLLPEQPLAELIAVISIADELAFRACYSDPASITNTARRDLAGIKAPFKQAAPPSITVTSYLSRTPPLNLISLRIGCSS
jgi:hypothetical protein